MIAPHLPTQICNSVNYYHNVNPQMHENNIRKARVTLFRQSSSTFKQTMVENYFIAHPFITTNNQGLIDKNMFITLSPTKPTCKRSPTLKSINFHTFFNTLRSDKQVKPIMNQQKSPTREDIKKPNPRTTKTYIEMFTNKTLKSNKHLPMTH